MNEREQKAFDQLPKPPEGAPFTLREVRTIGIPHPYCITPHHVAEAADHHIGMLTAEAIRATERKGHGCGMRGCQLPYDEHESNLTAVIEVRTHEDQQRLNDVPGLHAYLLSIKDTATKAGIDGFAFPRRGQ